MIEKIRQYSPKAHEYMTYVFMFILSLPDNFLTLGIVLWFVSWLAWRVTHQLDASRSIYDKFASFFFLGFVLINFGSVFWGHTPALGGRLIEHRLSLSIFSLLWIFGIYDGINKSRLATAYFAGALCSLVLFALRFSIAFFINKTFLYQLDNDLLASYIVEIKHPAYWSLNLVLAYFLFYSINRRAIQSRPLLFIAVSIIFSAFIFVSQSRAGVLVMLLATLVLIATYIQERFGKVKAFLAILCTIGLFLVGIVHTDKFSKIFDESEHVAMRAPRKVLWSNAFELVKENPIFGHGLGSSKATFVDFCQDNGIYNAQVLQLNCHNQFFETILESGLISSILLLGSIILCLLQYSKSRYYWFVLILMAISFCFESMLLRIAGLCTFIAVMFMIASDSKLTSVFSSKYLRYYKQLVLLLFVMMFFIGGLFLISHKLTFDAYNPNSYCNKDFIEVTYESLPSSFPINDNAIVGAKFDCSSTPSMWSGNTYMFNRIANSILKDDEQLVCSAYCYVSDDFDGTWVRLSIDTPVEGNVGAGWYNLKHKGTWQKLSVTIDDKIGEMPAYFYFCKHGVDGFEDLKGYVIFAYPQYDILKKSID